MYKALYIPHAWSRPRCTALQLYNAVQRYGVVHAWLGQNVLKCNELRRNECSAAAEHRPCSATASDFSGAQSTHAAVRRCGLWPWRCMVEARRLHSFRALLRVVDTCAGGCCRARPEASSHQVLASVSRQHCQLVWLLPDRPALLTIRLPGRGADVLSSQHDDRSEKLLSTVQIAGGAAADIH